VKERALIEFNAHDFDAHDFVIEVSHRLCTIEQDGVPVHIEEFFVQAVGPRGTRWQHFKRWHGEHAAQAAEALAAAIRKRRVFERGCWTMVSDS
jgi:hypothetical protein